jgi:hypothetical protein
MRLKFLEVQKFLLTKGYEVIKISSGYKVNGIRFVNLADLKEWGELAPIFELEIVPELEDVKVKTSFCEFNYSVDIEVEIIPNNDDKKGELITKIFTYKGHDIKIENQTTSGSKEYKAVVSDYWVCERFQSNWSIFEPLAFSQACQFIDDNSKSKATAILLVIWDSVGLESAPDKSNPGHLKAKVKNKKGF